MHIPYLVHKEKTGDFKNQLSGFFYCAHLSRHTEWGSERAQSKLW